MGSDDRYRLFEAARRRAELTAQDVWLRYIALGGTGDAFDVDGFLQGLVTLEAFQQDVLAQALNEGLDELCQACRIPLSAPVFGSPGGDHVRRAIDDLLGGHAPVSEPGARPFDEGT